jgi:Fungal specific transcription factor domain
MSLAGDEYAAKARQLLSLEFDRPTLSNVQALVILGLHEFGSSRGSRAWIYAGIAIRMAIGLGLNVEDETRLASQTWIESEIRRRVFWATFIMGTTNGKHPYLLRSLCILVITASTTFST